MTGFELRTSGLIGDRYIALYLKYLFKFNVCWRDWRQPKLVMTERQFFSAVKCWYKTLQWVIFMLNMYCLNVHKAIVIPRWLESNKTEQRRCLTAWPDVGIKISPYFRNVGQIVATAVFTSNGQLIHLNEYWRDNWIGRLLVPTKRSTLWGVTIAQWIRLRLPSCCLRFKSQAHYLHFHQLI